MAQWQLFLSLYVCVCVRTTSNGFIHDMMM